MTIHKNVKFTLDGKTKFTVGDEKFQWSGGWIDLINVWSGDVGKTYTSTVTLKGHDWGISTIRFVGDAGMKVVVTDADAGSNRWIEFLELGNAGSTVNLKSTGVGLLAGSDAIDKITLGSGRVDTIYLHDGNDSVKLGSGSVGSIYAAEGNDTVTIGSGSVDQINLGQGNNTFAGGKGWVGSVTAFDGDDSFTVGDGNVDMINMGNGKNTLNVKGSAYVSAVVAYNGSDTVNYTGSHDINNLYLEFGDNTVNASGSGYINSILAWDGNDTVELKGKMKGADTIDLGGGENHVTTQVGFVSSIITNSGNDTIVIGGEGAGQLVSWGGADSVTVSAWVGSILLGSGSDTVTLETGGTALSVLLRDGADSLTVSEVTDSEVVDQTCMFNGGNGTDTISFAAFTVGVDIDIAGVGEVVTEKGTFVVVKFENVIGGEAGDTLTGNIVANRLDGGEGSDSLTGGGSADVFVYGSDYGTDIVTDFNIADGDKIDLTKLAGVDSFADLSSGHMVQNGANVEIDDGNGDHLVLLNVAVADLTAAQFVF